MPFFADVNNMTDKKTSLSDVQLNIELKKLFEQGKTEKSNLYELLRTSYKIGKQRCLQAYDLAILEWGITKNKATDEQVIENTKEVLKKAILTKEERMEILTQIATGQIP